MTDFLPSIDPKERRRALGVRFVFWTVAAFYAYGATVHVLNMLSLTGFDWFDAPLKWQVLDVVYLILDVTVVIGLVRRMRIGVLAFFSAALSQIVLYTALRDWVLDVPDAFRPGAEQVAYLDTLVIFHIVTCVAMSVAIYVSCSRAG
ncbi:MAG: hypothetical protein AAF337_11035 [Pseudomonadota bacterium]